MENLPRMIEWQGGLDDLTLTQKFMTNKVFGRRRLWMIRVFTPAICLALFLLPFFILNDETRGALIQYAYVLFPLWGLLSLLVGLRISVIFIKKYLFRAEYSAIYKIRLEITENGLTASGKGIKTSVDWSVIDGVRQVGQGIIVSFGFSGLLIPDRSFESREQAADIFDLINARVQQTANARL